MTQQMQLPSCIIRGAIKHDPAEGMWDGVELLPDGYWKSTKLASILLGGNLDYLRKSLSFYLAQLVNSFSASLFEIIAL